MAMFWSPGLIPIHQSSPVLPEPGFQPITGRQNNYTGDMDFSCKSCITLTLLLLTFCISVCQGQLRLCDLSSRPHPHGICGETLTRVHSNLCFLMRQTYPEYFPSKRSAGDSNKEKILNIPLPALAELEPSFDTGDVLSREREAPNGFVNTEAFLSDDGYRPHLDKRQPLDSVGTRVDKTLQLMRGTAGDRFKRNVHSSGIVCDCCYNTCTLRHLATYC